MTMLNDVPTLLDRFATAIDAQPPATAGDALKQLRTVLDLRDEVAELDKQLSSRRQNLEGFLLNHHHEQGVNQFSDAGITISFNDAAMRSTYEPARWGDILRWASEMAAKNPEWDSIVQRRITDSKVQELIDKGEALPEGLNVEFYTKVSVKRK